MASGVWSAGSRHQSGCVPLSEVPEAVWAESGQPYRQREAQAGTPQSARMARQHRVLQALAAQGKARAHAGRREGQRPQAVGPEASCRSRRRRFGRLCHGSHAFRAQACRVSVPASPTQVNGRQSGGIGEAADRLLAPVYAADHMPQTDHIKCAPRLASQADDPHFPLKASASPWPHRGMRTPRPSRQRACERSIGSRRTTRRAGG